MSASYMRRKEQEAVGGREREERDRETQWAIDRTPEGVQLVDYHRRRHSLQASTATEQSELQSDSSANRGTTGVF
jgi:negative regulator of sigma E activity